MPRGGPALGLNAINKDLQSTRIAAPAQGRVVTLSSKPVADTATNTCASSND
jgi:hypothetical protein